MSSHQATNERGSGQHVLRYKEHVTVDFFSWGYSRWPNVLDEDDDHDVIVVMVEKKRRTRISPARRQERARSLLRSRLLRGGLERMQNIDSRKIAQK